MGNESQEQIDHIKQTGKLIRAADPSFTVEVRCDLYVYQSFQNLPAIGQRVATTRETRGFISTDDPSALQRASSFRDLVLVLDDDRRAGIQILNPQSGKVSMLSSFAYQIHDNLRAWTNAEAFKRSDALVGKVLSVPREEILRRDAEHKRK